MVLKLIKSKKKRSKNLNKNENEDTSEVLEITVQEQKIDEIIQSGNAIHKAVNEDTVKDNNIPVETKKSKRALLECRGFVSPPMFQITKLIHNSSVFSYSEGHAISKAYNNIFIFGGKTKNGAVTNKFIKFNTNTNEFHDLSLDIGQPQNCEYATLNYLENTFTNKACLILFGGRDQNSELSATYTFDLKENHWYKEDIQEKPTARCKHTAVTYKNNIIIYGGYSSEKGILNDMWIYDGLKYNKVIYKDNVIPEGRSGHTAVLWVHCFYKNSRIYVFGGELEKSKRTCNELWVYYINEKQWWLVKNYSGKIPSPRYMHGSSLFDNELLIVTCGVKEAFLKNSYLSDFYAFNLITNCWFEINLQGMASNWISKRHSFGLISYVSEKKEIYIFGGITENSTNPSLDIFKISPLLNYGYHAECKRLKKEQNKFFLAPFNSIISRDFNEAFSERRFYGSREQDIGGSGMVDMKGVTTDMNLYKNAPNEYKTLEYQISALSSLSEKLSKELEDLKEMLLSMKKIQEDYQIRLNESVSLKLFRLWVNRVENLEKRKKYLDKDFESFDNFEKTIYMTYAEGVEIPYNPKKVCFFE